MNFVAAVTRRGSRRPCCEYRASEASNSPALVFTRQGKKKSSWFNMPVLVRYAGLGAGQLSRGEAMHTGSYAYDIACYNDGAGDSLFRQLSVFKYESRGKGWIEGDTR